MLALGGEVSTRMRTVCWRSSGLTFSVDESFSRGRVRGGELLFDLGNVLRVKVVEEALANQVVLETAKKTR